MPMAEAWYVQGIKLDFSQATKLVSGPFDGLDDVFKEIERIRAFYPNITLRPKKHRAKSLPERKPRTHAPGERLADMPDPGYNLRKRAERERCADDIASRARALGATVEIENWDGEPDVDIRTPSLRATIWLAWTPAAPMPIISWYGASYPLRGVPGAWRAEQVNSAHRRKATSLPATWPELFDALETGICAAVDGTAFDFDA